MPVHAAPTPAAVVVQAWLTQATVVQGPLPVQSAGELQPPVLDELELEVELEPELELELEPELELPPVPELLELDALLDEVAPPPEPIPLVSRKHPEGATATHPTAQAASGAAMAVQLP
jgi:hypothetical protein